MDLFCRIISLENAAEFPIFCRTLSEALTIQDTIFLWHFVPKPNYTLLSRYNYENGIENLFNSGMPNQSLLPIIEQEFFWWPKSTTISLIEKGYSLFLWNFQEEEDPLLYWLMSYMVPQLHYLLQVFKTLGVVKREFCLPQGLVPLNIANFHTFQTCYWLLFMRWLTEAFNFSDSASLTWNEPSPIKIVQAAADPVKHFSRRQLFEGNINATLNWRFGLTQLTFRSLVIFFEGNSVARVSSSVTGIPPSYANQFGLDWIPNQNLVKLFIFNVTTEDNGTFSCRVTADSLDRFNVFQFRSNVQVDVVGKIKVKFRGTHFYHYHRKYLMRIA